ncbi:MAG: hypothetical protein OXC00_15295, partial [Acidimicrobiaceae bacterium]|nr:hypothetical protein [Acidimicrobiaceae bacterium]
MNVAAKSGLFQSSPSPKAGRSSRTIVTVPLNTWFQSSPSPKAGRSAAWVGVRGRDWLVSILAQPEGRTQSDLGVSRLH